MAELPKRKLTRLYGYDYSQIGTYFITVCVQNKECLLGAIIGKEQSARMLLSDRGKVLEKHIKLMDEKYPHISIDNYVIMPNHFHLLIGIGDRGTDKTNLPHNSELAKFISLLKRCCNREYGMNIWQKSSYDRIVRDDRDYDKIWDYIDYNVWNWTLDKYSH